LWMTLLMVAGSPVLVDIGGFRSVSVIDWFRR